MTNSSMIRRQAHVKEEQSMASQVHLGHVYHVAGSPKVTEAAAALVSIPDGALSSMTQA
jgi:guanine deaminase